MDASKTLRRSAVVVLASLVSLLAITACGRGDKTAAAPAGPKLYILDCGTISPMDPALFSLKKEEIKGDADWALLVDRLTLLDKEIAVRLRSRQAASVRCGRCCSRSSATSRR